MNSNKSLLIVFILAVAGSALVSFITLPSAAVFCLGVATTAFILWQKPAAEAVSSSSKPSYPTPPTTSDENTTLYVGNLSYKASESHVKELFEEYGAVYSVRLMKDKRTGKRRGFGFVEVENSAANAMISALNEFEYMQRTIKVRIANEPKHPAADEF
ncbi:RNA-binding protein [Vibrio sp. UCD-FRSSP16_10]|uniref:RNA recognition motif domain-containing protein n=1 Tax=unclassified Vibrio TaxID=2614977 RepID=UPI00080138D1|nr:MULTISPECIES: RNA-binding protein [unclassified Vibrio]OBT12955.1 RNA-binding protein [Vibrio sp. UCD-FRSSP16_30]OBT19200.1 RNA-binding protein [Vibrio sp. UCD-FRSSP16_10]